MAIPGAPSGSPAPHSSRPSLAEALDFFGWRAAAACSSLPPGIVFARRESEARPALVACRRCPVVARCIEAVAPAESFFDGVSGGRLWRNGRPVRLSDDAVAPSRATSSASYPVEQT
ncbi:WhiB family transcriptional regulator [Streptomyces sp. NPDC006879]|uniref:WhiB family transcriptional regulator n=1 Tax=Streptomyces sp. NPDC006879 TaxID=3364767 RepID=UPI0036A913ED